jgi:release factor glutamine methyltransferase
MHPGSDVVSPMRRSLPMVDTRDRRRLAAVVQRLRAVGCVFAEDEAALLVEQASSDTELAALLARRTSGEPLEHVLGWASFHGLRVAVDPGVFVPRRRTQVLVDTAVAVLASRDPGSRVVVDVCCGCGAVGTAVAHASEGVELHATDLDGAAVACARRNVAPMGGVAYRGDLFDPLPAHLRGRVDVVVANAPYVPTDAIATMPPEARDHEPRLALDGGTDGLDVQRRVVAAAPAWLRADGWLLVETSRAQADGTVAAFRAAGLSAHIVRDEEVDGTVVRGRAR